MGSPFIGRVLVVEDNDSLVDINASPDLEAWLLDMEGIRIGITGNARLPSCYIDRLINHWDSVSNSPPYIESTGNQTACPVEPASLGSEPPCPLGDASCDCRDHSTCHN